jgi:hypothetical protein
MQYLGDFLVGSTVRGTFNTRDASGAPITLASGTLRVYKDAGTTESSAGITLNTDFDSRTGLHLWEVDTSADGTFYSTGSDFSVVLTVGTVDGISVVGVRVGQFSIRNRSLEDFGGTATDVADAILTRDMSAVTGEAARSPLNALRLLRNKWSVSAGTLTVYAEDDATPAWTAAIDSDAAANPIIGSDPA